MIDRTAARDVNSTERAPLRATAGRLAISGALAVIAGLLLYLSFPPVSLGWWLAPIAIAMIVALCVRADRARGAAGWGVVFGMAFLLPLLSWVSIPVGAVPWIGLCAVEALFFGLFGVATRIVARLPVAPLWIAAVFTAVEWLRSSFPFGGFPWGRLAFGQAQSPLLPLVAIIGAPGLTFVVALLGAVVGVFASRLIAARLDRPGPSRPAVRVAVIGLVAVWIGALALSISLAAVERPQSDDSITVAAVQGNVPRLGLEFNAQRQAVLDNHARATAGLAAQVAAGTAEKPDIVLWPENASDIDPYRSASAAEAIDRAAATIGAPLLLGAVVNNGDGTGSNAALIWEAGKGPVGRYDKRILQPFGEYLPWRGFFEALTPMASMAGYFVPGNAIGLLDADISGGRTVPIAVANCFEVAFDRALLEPVRAGAELIYVPANTATFGVAMSEQQIAMSQIRAVEFGRTVVVPATAGRSAIIDPTGAIVAESDYFTTAVLVETVPLETRITLATHVGIAGEVVLIATGLFAVAAGVVVGGRRRRSAEPRESAVGDRPVGRQRGPE